MKPAIISRYIIREHVGPFFFGLGLLTLIFMLNLVWRDLGRLLSRGLELSTILEFLYLNLAWMIALAVPMAVLIATLMTFGRLSADNEITALKAGGVSFYQLLLPVLFLSLFVTAAMILFNDTILPEFNHRARLLRDDIVRKRPTLRVEPNVVFSDIPDMNLITKEVIEKGDSSRLRTVVIDDRSDPNVRRTIFAKYGVLKFEEKSDKMFLTLFDGEIHEIDVKDYEKYRILKFQRYRINVEIPGLSLKRSESSIRGDREMTIAMLKDLIRKNEKSIQTKRETIRKIIARQMVEGIDTTLFKVEAADEKPVPPPTGQEEIARSLPPGVAVRLQNRLISFKSQIQMELRIIRSYSRKIDSLWVEIHKKYSIPVACIIFVLVGAPLGVLSRKGNLGVSGGIAVLFYLIYWVFLIQGETLADRQIISPVVAMWSANVIVGLLGLYLVLYTVREYRPIQWEKLKPKFMRKYELYDQAG
jgi:lipopolysaccharide export system permease protein